MILAIGVDIVEVERIRSAMSDQRFLERVLTPSERKLAFSAQFVAGRWAAKEAVAKAVGTHLHWQDVEILPDSTGRPVATVLASKMQPLGARLHVSISHEKGHAVGMAVLESD